MTRKNSKSRISVCFEFTFHKIYITFGTLIANCFYTVENFLPQLNTVKKVTN